MAFCVCDKMSENPSYTKKGYFKSGQCLRKFHFVYRSKIIINPCGLLAAALIEGTILCMHGGLSPDLQSLEQVYWDSLVCFGKKKLNMCLFFFFFIDFIYYSKCCIWVMWFIISVVLSPCPLSFWHSLHPSRPSFPPFCPSLSTFPPLDSSLPQCLSHIPIWLSIPPFLPPSLSLPFFPPPSLSFPSFLTSFLPYSLSRPSFLH